MAEPIFGLTKAAMQDMAIVRHRVLGRMPDTGRRTRRVPPTGERFQLVEVSHSFSTCNAPEEDCNADCDDFTTGLVRAVKLFDEPKLCKCYRPDGAPFRAYDLHADDSGTVGGHTPQFRDRLIVWFNPQSSRWEVVQKIGRTGIGCCECRIMCLEATADVSVGTYGSGCSATLDLWLEQGSDSDGCYWAGSDESGASGMVWFTTLRKQDDLWTFTLRIACLDVFGGPVFYTATYELRTSLEYCGPLTVVYVSDDSDGAATFPVSITLNIGFECENVVECGDDPCCCLLLDLSNVELPFECPISEIMLSGYRSTCGADCKWSGLLNCGDNDSVRLISVDIDGDAMTIVVVNGWQVTSAVYQFGAAVDCSNQTATFATETAPGMVTWPETLPITVTDCPTTPPVSCGTCQYIWCADETQPIEGVSCAGSAGTWVLYANCSPGGAGCSVGAAPGSSGTYHGQIVTVDCTGTP